MKEYEQLKERRPRIKISDQEWERLKDIAENRGTTPQRIIEQFIYDLTCSNRSGGSDERDFAYEWLDRSIYNF